MKVLFLDFDGVLNTDKYLRSCEDWGMIVDPSRMPLLKKIIDATHAKIVLSTTWREHWIPGAEQSDPTGQKINELFAAYGLEIWDKTPELGQKREQEIKAWLDLHPEVEAFAVLDDMALRADYLEGHFVKTSAYCRGLDKAAMEAVIEILGVAP